MNITRKAPTPIRSTPSSAPLEAMVTKQQAHIDELVMRNRTAEQTIQKLKAEIEAEKQRHDANMQQLKQQFGQERTDWKEAADSLQNLWRAAYLRAVHDLSKERMEIVKLREELRLSRLAKLQRDYQIGMFQAKELESENHIVELQDQLDDAQWEYEQEHAKYAALKTRSQDILEELQELQEEKGRVEKSLAALRSDHTALLSSSGASSVSLERANLQIEGLKSSQAKLQDKHDELERTNADLLRQLEKWRNLDKRESEEGESLRKRKIELEIEVKELKEEVEQLRKITQERDDKYQNRIQKYKDSLKEHGDAIKERDDELEQKEGEIEELKKKLLDVSDEMKVLGAQLDAERMKAQQPKRSEPSTPKSAPKPTNDASSSKPKPRPIVSAKKPRIATPSDSDVEQRAKTKKKPVRTVEDQDEDIVEVEKPKAKKTQATSGPEPKQSKAVPKKSKKKRSVSPEIEVVDAEPGPSTRPGKRKAPSIEVDGDEPAPKKGKKPSTASSKPAPKPRNGPTKGKKAVQSESDSEAEPVQKKKKRKINIGNIFPSAQASTFDWGTMSQGDGGLNIPTELSPVKEASGVPTRPLSRALGSIASRR